MTKPPSDTPLMGPLDEAFLERHFQAMLPDAGVVTLVDLTGEVEIGCVDGRRDHCVAGAPGGSAGLLVILLACFEARSRRALTPEEVDDIFGRYLDRFGTFYLHTDRIAQDRLAAAIARAPWAADALDRGRSLDVDRLVVQPPELRRDQVLELLLDPVHMGCGHLAFLLDDPAAYRVRPGLAGSVLRSYFRRLWDGDQRLVFEVLAGTHCERGVARVRTDPPDVNDPCVVTVCPTHGPLQLFVHHPDVVAWLQERHADFLAEEGLISADAVTANVAAQHELGEIQLAATLTRLGADLPVFDVHVQFDGQGADVTVRRVDAT